MKELDMRRNASFQPILLRLLVNWSIADILRSFDTNESYAKCSNIDIQKCDVSAQMTSLARNLQCFGDTSDIEIWDKGMKQKKLINCKNFHYAALINLDYSFETFSQSESVEKEVKLSKIN